MFGNNIAVLQKKIIDNTYLIKQLNLELQLLNNKIDNLEETLNITELQQNIEDLLEKIEGTNVSHLRDMILDLPIFLGYFPTTAELLNQSGTNNDFAWNGETKTIWKIIEEIWTNTDIDIIPIIQPEDTNPMINGNVTAGVSEKYSRGDHVHPSDISKANVSDVVLRESPAINTEIFKVRDNNIIFPTNNSVLATLDHPQNFSAQQIFSVVPKFNQNFIETSSGFYKEFPDTNFSFCDTNSIQTLTNKTLVEPIFTQIKYYPMIYNSVYFTPNFPPVICDLGDILLFSSTGIWTSTVGPLNGVWILDPGENFANSEWSFIVGTGSQLGKNTPHVYKDTATTRYLMQMGEIVTGGYNFCFLGICFKSSS